MTAETFYQRTPAAGGKSLRVAMNLGHVYTSKGEYAKAEALFRRVLEISPDYTMARGAIWAKLCFARENAGSRSRFRRGEQVCRGIAHHNIPGPGSRP